MDRSSDLVIGVARGGMTLIWSLATGGWSLRDIQTMRTAAQTSRDAMAAVAVVVSSRRGFVRLISAGLPLSALLSASLNAVALAHYHSAYRWGHLSVE